MRILIIEDNPDIAGNIGDYLEFQGHVVDYASDGVMGLGLAVESVFEAIILDINLPKMDGFEVCRQLREVHDMDTPVLMLTARDSLADKVNGFQLGAWDYLVKPFELQELSIRLEALKLRLQPNRNRQIVIADLTLDLDSWQAYRQGKLLDLHRASLRILEVLMRASPNAVPRGELEFMLWGDEAPESDPLRSHMYELRREIDKAFNSSMLKTLRGIGFALRPDDPAGKTGSSDGGGHGH